MRTAFASFAIPRHAALAAVVWLAAFAVLRSQAAEDPLDHWEVTGNQIIQAVEYGNGRFVALGDHTYYSTNGLTWVRGASEGVDRIPTPLAYGGGKFVTVNEVGTTSSTSDGLAWDERPHIAPILTAVGYGRGQFVAAGMDLDETGMPVAVSPDGTTWTAMTIASRGTAVDVVFGEGRYIIDFSIPPVVSADGREWTTNGVINSSGAFALAHGNGTFVGAGFPLWVSADGLEWETASPSETEFMWGVAYGNGMFVVVGDGDRVFTSPDGLTWTPREIGITARLYCAAFGQGRFVIAGPGVVLVSGLMEPTVNEPRFKPALCRRLPDGAMLLTVEGPYGQPVVVEGSENMEHWEEVTTDPCDRGEFEVYDEAAADSPHRFYRAVKWEPPPPPEDPLMNWAAADTVLEEGQTLRWKLAYGHRIFVAAGKRDDTSGRAWFSDDGLTWHASNSTRPHENLIFGAGRFVSWASRTPLSTVNGQEWGEQGIVVPRAVQLGELAFGRGRFMLLETEPTDEGDPRLIWFTTSADGMQWQADLLPQLDMLPAIDEFGTWGAYARGRSVFVAPLNLITSTDGDQWDIGKWIWEVPPEITPKLHGLLYGAGRFFVRYGDVGMYISEDGLTWTKHTSESQIPDEWTHANGTFLGGSWDRFRNLTQMYGSVDGLNWTNVVEIRTSATPSDLLFAKGRFHLITSKGEVWRSGVMPPHVTEPRVIPELTYRLPDGAMLVTVEAPYGHEVVVEGSEDLETWQEIGRDPCDRGEFEVYHETAPPGTDWFYRARQVEP